MIIPVYLIIISFRQRRSRLALVQILLLLQLLLG
jgi:hypothetical protein